MPTSVDQPAISGRKGAKLYLFATVVAQMVALLRYVTLARLLGPEQLGLASTLTVTQAFFDLISDTGSDRFLIQDRDGDTPRAQRLVQLVYVCRGFLIAAGLALLSWPIAGFYNSPELAPGLVVLGLTPAILGFLHLDVRRTQRHQDFRGEAIMIICAESASLIATGTAAFLTHSYFAILFGLVSRACIMVMISHLRAKRPYGLAYAPELAKRLSKFAIPLMISGLFLFIGSQGDRVLVANRLGVAELGKYSAILLLIYYPSTVILRYMHVIYMPMVSAGRDDETRRDQVSDTLGGQTLLLALAMAVGFAIVAPPMVTLLYGAKFSQSATIVALIGILQTTRFLINWPTTVALSMGRSHTVMASNVIRILAYPGAFLGMATIGGLRGVLIGFIAGELVSIATAILLVNRDTEKRLSVGFDRFAAFIAAAILIVGMTVAIEWRSIPGVFILMIISGLLATWLVRREAFAISQLTVMIRQRLAIQRD